MQHLTLVALLSAGLLVSACNNKKPENVATGKTGPEASAAMASPGKPGEARANRPQSVSTTMTRVESVPLTLEAQGSVLALDEVELRPQKNGTIKEVLVREGTEVRRGQLLFVLDDRDDNANVERAAANVSGAEAALSVAKRDLARTQDLSARNFVSPSALDTQRSKVEAAEAQLAQSKASLEQAKVSQSFTRVTAPFEGRAGRVDVRPGALVTANSTQVALVKITRMHPIGVSFTLPESNLPDLLAAQRKGPVKVSARIDATHEIKGEVSFIDSSVDRNSGTIAVKAKLDNSTRAFWPGQYVTVRVEAGLIPNATVLPAQAVINGPNGRLVYVVGEDSTVQPKPVELIRIVDEKAVITGIAGGVKVVLEGAQNLRPGAKISEAHGEGQNGNGRRNKDAQSAPVADSGKPVATAEERKTARPKADAAEAKPDAGGSKQAAASSGVVLPVGFTPRDPERWASASDEQKREIISRWRERQAAQAAGASAQ